MDHVLFQAVSLSNTTNFNWVFLVDWILVILLAWSVIFYFGRVFAFVVTWVLDFVLWKAFSISIDITSLKISFLGGRVFFKNLTVITPNEMVAVLEGSFTWRYWLPNARKTEYELSDDKSTVENEKLPARFKLEMRGLEVFMYNKSAAYDHLESVLKDDSSSEKNSEIVEETVVASLGFIKFLPIDVEVSKGALVVGNDSTSSLVIMHYEKATGLVNVSRSRSQQDLYNLNFGVKFETFKLYMKPNVMHSAYNKNLNITVLPQRASLKKQKLWKRFKYKFLEKMKELKKKPGLANQNEEEWKGLSFYMENDWQVGEESSMYTETEYAKFSTIVDADVITTTYAFDAPGLVPKIASPVKVIGPDIGNGGPPPDFLLHLCIANATIHWGPWAHRQMLEIQRMLFPVLSRDIPATTRLTPGELRVYTRFRMVVDIDSETLLRTPTRESSKNKQYMDLGDDKARPFGWFEFELNKGSSMETSVALLPTASGYQNNFCLTLHKPVIRSSVNHDTLFIAEQHQVVGDISYPLGWNSEAIWHFDQTSKNVKTFFLREHITLLSDLLTDFGSGEPIPYELFRPFIYKFSWIIDNYEIYLNVNDANVVNNPLDFNENIYISFHGERLETNFTVPFTKISRKSTCVEYRIMTPMFSMRLDTPPWHTANAFMKNNEVGRSYDFVASGSYTYFTAVDLGNTDFIVLECVCRKTTLECYGFLVRYMMNVKTNYFGEFVCFRTVEEYTMSTEAGGNETATNEDADSFASSKETGVHYKPTVRRNDLKRVENEMDVLFSFCVEGGCLVLPENIYDCDACIALCFDSLDIDIRFLNYYMDIQADFSPIEVKRFSEPTDVCQVIKDGIDFIADSTIDCLAIHGHRMFGLPPTEETYFCKWDFKMGVWEMTSSDDFLKGLVSCGMRIGFGFEDLENALIFDIPTIFDMTAVTFLCDGIQMDIENNTNKFLVNLKDLSFKFIDFTNERYSSRLTLSVPEVDIKLIDSDKNILVNFDTSILFNNFGRKRDAETHMQNQRDHISLSDAPFHRLPYLLPREFRESELYKELFGSLPPSSTLPCLSMPLNANSADVVLGDLVDGRFMKSCEDSDSIDDSSVFSSTAISTDDDFSSIEGDESQKIIGSDLPAITDYYPDEFTPTTPYDPTFEYDDLVVDVGAINVSIVPKGLFAILHLSKSFGIDTVESVLNSLEVASVMKMAVLAKAKDAILNVRFLTPAIKIVFANFDGTPNATFEEHDHIKLCLTKPSVALSVKKLYQQGTIYFTETSTSAIHVNEMTVQLVKAEDNTKGYPFSFVAKELEFWSDSEVQEVNSFKAETISLDLNPHESAWLGAFANKTFETIKLLQQEFANTAAIHETMMQNVLFRIAEAGVEYKIEYDPAVITKPAHIMRLSKDHVRVNRSWRIITRLRHVLKNLPSEWHANAEMKFKEGDFKCCDDSTKAFVNIFSKWRNWEASNVQDTFIFQHVFLSKDFNLTNNPFTKTDIAIDNISINLTSEVDQDDNFAAAHHVNVRLDTEKVKRMLKGEDMPTEEMDVSDLKILAEIGSVRGCFTKVALELKKLVDTLDFNSDQVQLVSKVNTVDAARIHLFNMTLVLHDVNVNLILDDLSVVLRTTQCSVAAFGALPDLKEDVSVSFITNLKGSTLRLKFKNATILESMSENGNILCAFTGGFEGKCKKFDLDLGLWNLNFFGTPQQVVEIVRMAKQKGKELDQVLQLKDRPTDDNSSIVSTFLPKILQMAHGKVHWEKLSAKAQLSSLQVRSVVGKGYVDVTLTNDVYAMVVLSQFDLELHSSRTRAKYAHFIQSGLQGFVKINETKVDADIKNKVLKLQFFDSGSLMVHMIRDFEELLKHIEMIEKEISCEVKTSNEPFTREATSMEINLSSFFGYIGFAIGFGPTNNLIEIDDVTAIYTPTQWDVILSKAAFLLHDPLIDHRYAKIVDFNLSIKGSESLQLESKYFHIALSPHSLVKLLWVANEGSRIMDSFDFKPKPKPVISEKKSFGDLPFESIHLLSYDLCIGWMFGDHTPGLNWGFGRLFAAYGKNFGKLTLLSAYFSGARGCYSDDFYSLGDEEKSFNRTYLPSLQILYWIKKNANDMRDVEIKMSGDQLDANLLPSAVSIAERTVRSIHKYQDLKKQLIRSSKLRPKAVKVNSLETEKVENSSVFEFFSTVSSVKCTVNYAGGVLKLFSSELKTHPVLELMSPSVQILGKYNKLPIDNDKRHSVVVEVMMNPSENILYPMCVPVLSGMLHDVRALMKRLTKASQPPPVASSTTPTDLDYKKMLADIDVICSILVDKQALSLSCEPTAKVQAIVGLDGMEIRVATNDLTAESPLAATLLIEKLMASSQHIYSREVSASVGIDRIVTMALLTHPSTIEVALSTYISDVSMYVNMKQMQDVNLFKDIWTPVNYFPDGDADDSSASANLVTKYQKVSNTAAFPWNYEFITKNITVRLDMGQALGVLQGSLDRVWAVSKKTSDWEQNLTVGFDNIMLESIGRMGGTLALENLRWKSVIMWPTKENNFEPPLVFVTSGVQSVQLKCSFDYHLFLVARMTNFTVSVFNQKEALLHDLLGAAVSLGDVEIYFTALTPAILLDIFNAFNRIQQDTKKLYTDTLKEAAEVHRRDSNLVSPNLMRDKSTHMMINTLRTQMAVSINRIHIQVSPSTLFDPDVVVLDIGAMRSNISTQGDLKNETQIDLKLADIGLSLSTLKKTLDEANVTQMLVKEYISVATASPREGKILVLPSLSVEMSTFESPTSNIVEYTFTSKFADKIDIRWNLGSINYIKEMWAANERALALRRGITAIVEEAKPDDDTKIKDVDLGDKYHYVALEKPIIDKPQIRDLGDATPPLEWFGVNRDRLPGLTHQVVVVPLQELVDQVEREYARVLGHA